jgi:hypothetical protein
MRQYGEKEDSVNKDKVIVRKGYGINKDEALGRKEDGINKDGQGEKKMA